MLGALGLGGGDVERRLELAEDALGRLELGDGIVLREPRAQPSELRLDDAPPLSARRVLDALEQIAGRRVVREREGDARRR